MMFLVVRAYRANRYTIQPVVIAKCLILGFEATWKKRVGWKRSGPIGGQRSVAEGTGTPPLGSTLAII